MDHRWVWGLLFGVMCGCSGHDGVLVLETPLADGGTVVVGSACVPDIEKSSTFDGFAIGEVSLESVAGAPSGDAVCLAYKFQGLTTCPYGQPAGGGGCATPEGALVVGAVRPQCVDRRPSQAVVWSCRCSNTEGQTNDGQHYCDCPSGTACVQAVGELAGSSVAGGYCVPAAAASAAPTCNAECAPGTYPCE
jgi:hypothetical protein